MMKQIMILPLIVVATMVLASCKRPPESSAWQQKLKEAAELGTVQYTVQKVVSNSDETWQLFGDRKILISFKAIIKAGLDMEKFNAESVRIKEDKKTGKREIELELPQPEILAYNIKPDDVKKIYSSVSLLRTEYTSQERAEIVVKGELELKNDKELTEMILKDARQNARMFMDMLLRQSGFTDVNIKFKQEVDHGTQQ